jgi:ATP-dependent DNA ligase
LSRQFPQIAEALAELPDDTVIDSEVVAMGDDGRPNFKAVRVPITKPDEDYPSQTIGLWPSDKNSANKFGQFAS